MRHKTITDIPKFTKEQKLIEAKRIRAEEKKLKRQHVTVEEYRGAISNILCDLSDEFEEQELYEAQWAIREALRAIHTYNFREVER